MKEQSTVVADTGDHDIARNRRETYNRVVFNANLVNIHLQDIQFKNSPDALMLSEADVKRRIQHSADLLSHDKKTGLCLVSVDWKLEIKHKRKTISSCKASYIVIYSNMVDCESDIVEEFSRNVATVAAYAYFRALYAHIDWAAGAHSPPLPLFRTRAKV